MNSASQNPPAVRELLRDDLAELLTLYDHLHADDSPAPSNAELRALWEQIVADPHQFYFGAFVDGSLASAANVSIIRNLTRSARPFAVIENVVTHADHRRKGLGRAVLTEVLRTCAERDCYKVMLMSGAGRESIHSFYRAIGFDGDAKRAFIMRL